VTEPQEVEGHRDGRDEASKPRYSRLAVAALVVTVLGFLLIPVAFWGQSHLPVCFALLLWAGGLVMAIAALVRIRSSGGRYRGYPSAVTAAVLTGIILITITAVYLAFCHTTSPPWTLECLSDVGQLSKASIAYAVDHDGQFPNPDAWLDVLKSERYIDSAQELGNDPRDADAGRMFAMNAALAGCRIDQVADPDRTVLFFECRTGAPPAGGPELLPPEPRFKGGYLIAFLDGHVECVPREKVGDLVWDPRQP